MKKLLSVFSIISLVTSVTLFAGEAVSAKKVVVPKEDCRFRSHEWQIDLGPAGFSGYNSNKTVQGFGADVGINYFFCKYIGIGIDDNVGSAQTLNVPSNSRPHGPYAYNMTLADLIVRYPICAWNLAPYAMVGGGANWVYLSQGLGCVGGGLDYRITSNIALFADCRWLYGTTAKGGNVTVAMPRAGIRFAL